MTEARSLSLFLAAALLCGAVLPAPCQISSSTEDAERAKSIVQQGSAQSSQNEAAARQIVAVGGFTGEGVDDSAVEALRGLIMSYLVEFDEYRIVDSLDEKASALKPDISVSGRVIKVDSLYIENLSATVLSTGENRTAADSFSSMNELLLSSRRLASQLFDRGENGPAALDLAAAQTGTGGIPDSSSLSGAQSQAGSADSSAQSTGSAREDSPTLKQIAGTWSGDRGIERISIFPDGRAVALLDSGTIMRLTVSISNATVTIEQDGPNSPSYYRSAGISLAQARIIASQARPWVWIFTLSADGRKLSGQKQSVFVRISTSGELSVDNSYVREAFWTRK